MPLTTCRECNHQISDRANTCPQCGKKLRTHIAVKAISIIAIGLLIYLIITALAFNNQPPTQMSSSNNTENLSKPTKFTINHRAYEVLKWLIDSDKKETLEGRDTIHSAIMLQQDVSAQKIATAYEDNEVYGDAEFFKKIIRVSGTIRSIESGLRNAPYITFDVENKWQPPHAKFKENLIEQIATLRREQDIVLVCVGAGEIAGNAILDSCEFAETYIKNNMPDLLVLITNYVHGIKSNDANYSKIGIPRLLAIILQTEIYLPNAHQCLLPPNDASNPSTTFNCMANSKPNIMKMAKNDTQNGNQTPEVEEARAKLDTLIKTLDEHGLNEVSVVLKKATEKQQLFLSNE